jgi:glycosyltransferase involved in cell wall biosynthesis
MFSLQQPATERRREPLRILHCIPNMAGGGAERQLTYLATEQKRQGDLVHVALLDGGPNLERLRESGATLHFIPAAGNHDPRILLRLVGLIRRLRPDVVQTWLTQMDVLGGLAAIACRVPWILSERASSKGYPTTAKNWLRALLAARADAIVCNSGEGRRYWCASRGHVRNLREIPNPVPIEEIDRVERATDEELQVLSGGKVVLFVGRLLPQKNLDSLVPALALAAGRAPFAVRICGEGDRATLDRLIRAHGLGERTWVTGYQPRAWAWMKRADLFITLSRFEGHPNTTLEAAACGCPLILSDIVSHRELFDEGSALLVRSERAHEVADAIVRTLARNPETEARARRARERVANRSLALAGRSWDDVYRSVLGERTVV